MVCYKDDFEKQKSSLKALCTLVHQLFLNRYLITDAVLEEHGARGEKFAGSFSIMWTTFLDAVRFKRPFVSWMLLTNVKIPTGTSSLMPLPVLRSRA